MSKKKVSREHNEQALEDMRGLFHELEQESDRGVALVGVAFLDELLRSLLTTHFVDDEKTVAGLVEPTGPLGNLSGRTKIAFVLGLITKDECDNLDRLRSIRNTFAHDLHGRSFDDPDIKAEIHKLKLQNLAVKPGITEFDRRGWLILSIASLAGLLNSRKPEIERGKMQIRPNAEITFEVGGEKPVGTLFKNGTIITAAEEYRGDVLVEGEMISLIGRDISADGHDVVNCEGKLLMPGGIDVHTHLDLPFGGTISNDDFETGHIAAAFGGTTSHIDFVIQPIGGSLADGLKTWRAKAEKAHIDYGFHMAVTDLRDEVMAELPSMVDEGITSLKVFMAYKNVFMVDDDTLFRTMQVAADNGMIVMVHAENGDVEALLTPQLLAAGKTDPKFHAQSRPPEIEGEATNRAVVLSGMTGCPLYVVHMTCEPAIQALARGRANGYPVMGETCTQYMFLTVEEHLAAPGFEGSKYVCSPPIRTTHDHEVLWQALRNGTLQAVSTDHCDFWYDGGHGPWQEWQEETNNTRWDDFEAQDPSYRRPGKELGAGNFAKIPNGMPGLEDRMMVMWHHGVNSGRFSASRFVELLCTNPAKIFGMYPRKGAITVGADADILVWDPDKEHTISADTHHMRVDYNCYEGMTVRGVPVQVYQRGRKIVDGDAWLGEKGGGQFIPRSPHAPVL